MECRPMGAHKNYHNLEYVYSRLACPFFMESTQMEGRHKQWRGTGRPHIPGKLWPKRLSLGGLLAAKQRMHWKTFVLSKESKECAIHPGNGWDDREMGEASDGTTIYQLDREKMQLGIWHVRIALSVQLLFMHSENSIRKGAQTLTLEEWKREKWKKRTTQKNRTK